MRCQRSNFVETSPAPITQLIEHWVPGSDSPGSRRSSAQYMILPAGMVRGRCQGSRPAEVSERGGPCRAQLYGHVNPQTDGGISAPPPLRLSINSGETAARSAAKFYMALYPLILRAVCKLPPTIPPTIQGQVTRSPGMTRRHVPFSHVCRCARAAVHDRTF